MTSRATANLSTDVGVAARHRVLITYIRTNIHTYVFVFMPIPTLSFVVENPNFPLVSKCHAIYSCTLVI